MKGLPSRCSSFCPMMRAISPVEPPGANGTTKVTGLLGYWLAVSCAPARGGNATDSISVQPIKAAVRTVVIVVTRLSGVNLIGSPVSGRARYLSKHDCCVQTQEVS